MAAHMQKRLAKELSRLRDKTLASDGLAVENPDDLGNLPVASGKGGRNTAGAARAMVVLLAGPRGSPFEGGVFRLQVDVPLDYPMAPPKMKFTTKLFHPNVGAGHTPGAICLDILRKEAWSPALTLEKALLSIASLLADPNPASPMDDEAARLYKFNRPAYDKRVQELVRKHAQPGSAAEEAWAGSLGKADEGDEASNADSRPAAADAPAAEAPSAGRAAEASADGAVPGVVSGVQLQRRPCAEAAEALPSAAAALPEWARPVVIDLDDESDEDSPAKRARTT